MDHEVTSTLEQIVALAKDIDQGALRDLLDALAQEGWDAGNESGYNDGRSDGYSEGYSDGDDEGYGRGYEDGQDAAE